MLARRRTRAAVSALLLGAAAIAAVLAVQSGWTVGFGADEVLARRDALRAHAAAEPLLAFAAFVGLHVVLVSTALPVGPSMSLLAGILFGRWWGTAAISAGATVGALIVHRLARGLLREPLLARAGPRLGAIGAELRDNAFGYVVFMRLVPVFPFFLVNVASGAFGVPARPFALATLVGRLPATVLYVGLGQDLGRAASVSDLFSPGTFLALTLLGLLALAPVAWKHLRRRVRGGGSPGRR